MTKKWQKSSKSKKSKNQKNRKSDKTQKSRKSKITKIRKTENEKHEKWQKMHPPWKRPKCQINGTFWHFVKSEPPGPAYFRFQGVPRDPILRPKSDPPLFWCFLIIFIISDLCIFTFFMFLHFIILVKIAILWSWHFLWHKVTAIVIRPYGVHDVGENIHRGDLELCVVVLPSLIFVSLICVSVLFFC